MNFQNLKIWLANITGFFALNPMFLFVLFGVILFIVIGFVIQSGCERRAERKDEQRKEEILRNEGALEILKEERKEVNKNVKKLEINSNRADVIFNAVVNTDSSNRSSDFGTVRRKFCEQFPQDSKCR